MHDIQRENILKRPTPNTPYDFSVVHNCMYVCAFMAYGICFHVSAVRRVGIFNQ